jgi:hypothetical protein
VDFRLAVETNNTNPNSLALVSRSVGFWMCIARPEVPFFYALIAVRVESILTMVEHFSAVQWPIR